MQPPVQPPVHPPAPTLATARRLRWTVWAFFFLFLAGACSRGYGDYNQTRLHDPATWTRVLDGTASAPEQYRIGIVVTADVMARHLPVTLSQSFAILDMLFAMLAVLLLFDILERSPAWLTATTITRCFGAALFCALALYALDWAGWYHRVTTLPTVGFIALLAWLWTPRTSPSSPPLLLRNVVLAFDLLAVAVLQSFIRADIVVALFAGTLLAALAGWGRLALSRTSAALTSLAGIAIGGGVQFYLSRVRYPQATYGRVPVLMLFHDYRQGAMWMALLIFIAPLLWTLQQLRRKPAAPLSGAGPALLIAAVGYLGLWILLGRLDEVRIFLPMALATLPATTAVAITRLSALSSRDEGSDSGTSLS